MTEAQKKVFEIYQTTNKHLFLKGSAGTGKSFIGLWLLLNDVLDKKYDKLIIVRTATPVKEIGYLKGSEEEKMEVYETPYKGIFDSFFPFKKSYENLKEVNKVEFMSTSHIRGVTLDNCAIFIDEVSSMTYHEIYSVLTRVGQNSRIIMAGDFRQNDLCYKRFIESGFLRLEKIIKKVKSIEEVSFTHDDIVRSEFVKELIIAEETTPHD